MRTGVLFWSGPAMLLAMISVTMMARSLEQPRGPVILCDADCYVRVPPAAIDIHVLPVCDCGPNWPPTERDVVLQAAPKPTKRVLPRYPEHIELTKNAEVELAIDIGKGGRVGHVDILSEEPRGHRFGEAALNAVRQWEFATAEPGRYRLTVKFSLE
jgi:TonB family protein